MKSTTDIKRFAARCRMNAEGSVSGDERAALLERAAAWEALANLREGVSATRRALQPAASSDYRAA